jgi:DNA-binding GntR family transcriptional regulator
MTERALAFETGWGIGPIREALKRLENEGLVRTLPRRGYLVTPLTTKSVDDLFALWRLLAPELARTGIERATPEQMARVRGYADEERSPGARPTSPTDEALARMRSTLSMFDVLAESSANEYFVIVFRRIAGDLSRVGALLLRSQLAEPAEFLEVLPRVDGLLAGDATAAADEIRQTIDVVREGVLRILSRWPSATSSEVTAPARSVRD